MNRVLADIMEKARKWPKERQDELAYIAGEIDMQVQGGVYHATPEELQAIDEAMESGVASSRKVAAAFRKFRS
jgi:hypothetical protein